MSWYFTPVLYAIFVLDLKIVQWETSGVHGMEVPEVEDGAQKHMPPHAG